MFRPSHFTVDHNRFYYEPRVYWSVGRVSTSIQDATPSRPAGYLRLPPEDFYNGSRFPIRFTHMIVSPVGYLFRRVTATVAAEFDQCMAGLGRARVVISFPRRSWLEHVDTDLFSLESEPTVDPGMRTGPTPWSSGLFGTSRWTFPLPYIVPRKATIELELSTIQTSTEAGQTALNIAIPASMIVQERGGRMLGHGRWRPQHNLEYAPSPASATAVFPAGQRPVVPDFFFLNNGAAGPQVQVFPGTGRFPSDVYNRQLASRGLPYTELDGFAVAIDQITYDDAVIANVAAGSELAPIAQRIATHAKTRDAGTGEDWWRRGAPLSLVCPTMTPAIVKELDDPFILGPGEGIEVALQAPPSRTFTFNQAPITVQSIYNVGVSFCGYACVQDENAKVYR